MKVKLDEKQINEIAKLLGRYAGFIVNMKDKVDDEVILTAGRGTLALIVEAVEK